MKQIVEMMRDPPTCMCLLELLQRSTHTMQISLGPPPRRQIGSFGLDNQTKLQIIEHGLGMSAPMRAELLHPFNQARETGYVVARPAKRLNQPFVAQFFQR